MLTIISRFRDNASHAVIIYGSFLYHCVAVVEHLLTFEQMIFPRYT